MIGNQLEASPFVFYFSTTNQMRHCFTRYVEYHRSVTQLYTSHSSFVFLSMCFVFLSNKVV
ncbi:Cytochrome c oxidase subunit 6b-2 [Capsicum annuum]|uniref:Cytochrome c oxidase subunit 6b-2 n=1 Tax=Capsicum annuum TaxID=4072 RepID=A0A2G2YWZ9_CAPAN|nr:Cytochrome c oxidase subunit 6b-2 [Capsicum annuum]